MPNFKCVVDFISGGMSDSREFPSSVEAFDFVYPNWASGNWDFNPEIDEYIGSHLEVA